MSYLFFYTVHGFPARFTPITSLTPSVCNGMWVFGPLAKVTNANGNLGEMTQELIRNFNDGIYDDVEVDFSESRQKMKFCTYSKNTVGKLRFILSQVEHLAKNKKCDNCTLTKMVVDFLLKESKNDNFDSRASLEYPFFEYHFYPEQ